MTFHLLNSRPRPLTPKNLFFSLIDQELSEEDLTSSLVFLTASVTLLSGVMMMDGHVQPEERGYLQQIISVFTDANTHYQSLVSRLTLAIQQHQVYLNPQLFLMVGETLDLPQRLLLLGLGYGMAVADGHLGDREAMYLRAIAHRLQIHPTHLAVLEASFRQQSPLEPKALQEVSQYLEPSAFVQDEPLFRMIARTIHSNLPDVNALAS